MSFKMHPQGSGRRSEERDLGQHLLDGGQSIGASFHQLNIHPRSDGYKESSKKHANYHRQSSQPLLQPTRQTSVNEIAEKAKAAVLGSHFNTEFHSSVSATSTSFQEQNTPNLLSKAHSITNINDVSSDSRNLRQKKSRTRKVKKKCGNKTQEVTENPNSHQKNESKQKNKIPLQDLLTFTRIEKSTPVSSSTDNVKNEPSTMFPSYSSSKLVEVLSDCDSNNGSQLSSDSDCSDGLHKTLSGSTMNLYSAVDNSCIHEERVVSVYWDIENCPVPSNKSAVDIVKKIRNTFYDRRVECSFTVACDMRNLNSRVVRELSESDVTLVHADSQSKNAADSRLQKFLLNFQFQYRLKNAAIVLISGDSDFSTFLYEMRYKHHIYVNLICRRNARKALKEAAHRCVIYEDFINDLASHHVDESKEFFLIVSNLPDHIKTDALKASLLDKIQGISTKITVISDTQIEMLFSTENLCKQAGHKLQGCSIYGSNVNVEYKVRNSMQHQAKKLIPNDKEDVCQKQVEAQIAQTMHKVTEEDMSRRNVTTAASSAALCIHVTDKQGDVSYWGKEFARLFDDQELSVQWYDAGVLGYFIVKFKSLSKAGKAKLLLETNQKNNNNAPKFLKLLVSDADISISGSNWCDIKDVNLKKIEEKVSFVQMKQGKCLNNFQALCNSLKSSTKATGEMQFVVTAKLDALNEQKNAFLKFIDATLKKLKNLDASNENIDSMIDDIMMDYSHECMLFKNNLPIYTKRNLIIKKIKEHQVIMIHGETGSGKSTQICQYLWREGFGSNGLIICAQPEKVAAILAAKCISSQIGCPVGNIVGYEIGLSKKVSERTKILFTTDCTLLNMCYGDPFFEKASCIVIDEAHQRTVYTDLLLGMVKKAVQMRPRLKVVITSGIFPVNVFQRYFNLPDDAVLSISGHKFPVEDVWLNDDVTVRWGYLDKAIDVTYSIVKEEEPGDILVFLPALADVEHAVEKFADKVKKQNYESKLVVCQLHDSIDAQTQQKIFEKTPTDARKIVFATNFAETSVSIPGIRYVIDTGLVKKFQYDSTHNINILSVKFIDKISAEQRRSHAGSNQRGKCYRLYSHTNYKRDMAVITIPEILQTNMSQAFLKLLHLGINSPLKFDFIESPSKDSSSAAVKQLIHFGAFDRLHNNFLLTNLGCKMSKLPLEPRLCYLILKGIEHGVSYNCIVISALTAVSRNRSICNVQDKDNAESKKVRFQQSESDFLTFLEVYKEWSEVPKMDKLRWCMFNGINSQSMQLAYELVNELVWILCNDLGFKISEQVKDGTEFISITRRIIFHSFAENLCIFTGHSKIGCLSLNISENLYIHPSSSVCNLGNLQPHFLVCDTIVKAHQMFLMNVSLVDDDDVRKAVDVHFLDTDLSQWRSLIPVEYNFSKLGHGVLRTIIGSKGCNVEMLLDSLGKICNSNYCAINADFNNGILNVYAPLQFHDQVRIVFTPLIENVKDKLLKLDSIIKISGIPTLSAVFGAGGRIYDVVKCGEYREVKIRPPNCDISLVLSTLGKFGEITDVKETKKCKCITFCTVESAKKAVQALGGSTKDFSITPGENSKILNSTTFFKVLLKLVHKPNWNDNKSLSETVKSKITGMLVPFAAAGKFQIDLKAAVQQDNYWEATVFFDNPHDGQNIAHVLNPGIKSVYNEIYQDVIEIRPILEIFLFCKKEIFNAIKNPIEEALKSFNEGNNENKQISICARETNDKKHVSISVSSNNIADIIDVRKTINPLIEGDKIKCLGNPQMEKLFSAKSKKFLKAVSLKVPNSFVNFNDYSKIISVFGTSSSCTVIKSSINKYLTSLKEEEISTNISLKSPSNHKSLLKEVIRRYGLDLKKLCSACTLSSAKINAQKQVLIVSGNEDSISQCRNVIAGIMKGLENNTPSNIKEKCPVCCYEVAHPSHRLEYCDHLYCEMCILLHFQSTEETPILCCAKGCKQPIVLQDFTWAFMKIKALEETIYSRAFISFIKQNPNVKFCPTPDCYMVYRSSDGEECPRITCSFCKNDICTKCGVLYHAGMNCDFYQRFIMDDNKYSLSVWLKTDPVVRKLCPSCQSPIEKYGKTFQMTCWRCNCHMCWQCMKTFQTSDDVYWHLSVCTAEK